MLICWTFRDSEAPPEVSGDSCEKETEQLSLPFDEAGGRSCRADNRISRELAGCLVAAVTSFPSQRGIMGKRSVTFGTTVALRPIRAAVWWVKA